MNGVWLGVGALVAILFGISVLFFFGALKLNPSDTEEKWNMVQEQLSDKHQFKFFGDCGAPQTLSKMFGKQFSCNAMVGIAHGNFVCDVLDFALSRAREVNAPHVNGIVLTIPKMYLKDPNLKTNNIITYDSQEGEYQVVDSPNENYVYILVVNDDYRPVTFESIEWRSVEDMCRLISKNIEIVDGYLSQFCNFEVVA